MSKPGKVLRNLCKKLGVRLTVKRGKKRVYKSVKVLKRQCAKKKKKKIKRRRKFGVPVVSKDKNLPESIENLIQDYLMITPQEVHKNKMKVMNQILKEKIDNELHLVFSYLDDMTGNMGELWAMFIIENDFYHYNRNTRTFVMDAAWKERQIANGENTGPNELPFESFQEMDEERFHYSFELAQEDIDWAFDGRVKPNLVQRMIRVYPRIGERFPQYLTLPNEFGKKRKRKKVKRKRKKVKKKVKRKRRK